MPTFAALLVALNYPNLYGPAPSGFASIFVLVMLTYLGFAAVANWLDRYRVPN